MRRKKLITVETLDGSHDDLLGFRKTLQKSKQKSLCPVSRLLFLSHCFSRSLPSAASQRSCHFDLHFSSTGATTL